MIKTAYLRVYVPADGRRWPPYGGGPRHRVVRSTESFVWDEPIDDDAFLLEHGGRSYVCPRHPRLRMLEGLMAFAADFPTMPLVAGGRLDPYVRELEALRRREGARSHILSSPWHVPLRWFAAFSPEDRELYADAGRPSIRYRGSLARAVERLAWAAAVLDAAGFSEPVVDQVRDLERWLTEFPAEAIVELDYGSVAELFTAEALVADETCAEVRESLLALERGDVDEAGDRYLAAATRWAPHQALTYSN
ncbi:MAG TPA: hypothetical protein ENK55_09475 [Actinobacteria bacterium]|nr:hypothetical protein [Actinomycetota bacterium]